MDIKEALETTRRAVEDAGLPGPWGEIAFREVLRSILNGRDASQSPSAATVPATAQQEGRLSSVSSTGLNRLASRLNIAESALEDVFAAEEDNVSLYVASGKLPTTKSKATREIALLIVAARQGAGTDESWTDVEHVREALMQYNRYDASNFAKYLRDTGDVFNFKGKPIQQIRLTRPGWEAATDLVKTLTGSER